MGAFESYYMNAFQYLTSLPYIGYHHLLLAKRYEGWQWAVEAYCPKDLKGKVWMVYLDKVVNQEQIIYELWRHDMRHKAITIPPYDDKNQDRFIICGYLKQYYEGLACIT